MEARPGGRGRLEFKARYVTIAPEVRFVRPLQDARNDRAYWLVAASRFPDFGPFLKRWKDRGQQGQIQDSSSYFFRYRFGSG